MLVTPEVFQPEMFALKYVRPVKSSDMSVMAETSQSAMGPYSAMAELASLLNSWAATFRAFRFAKEYGGGDAGGGEGGGGKGARPGG
jgi:hypothetical protein